MVNQKTAVDCSDKGDPLSNCSTFSLFPNHFPSSSSSTTTTHLVQTPSFDILPSLLFDLASRNPEYLMNQGNVLCDGNLGLITSDNTGATLGEGQSEALYSVNDKIRQERRPGLGLKRAKFSLKCLPSSQPDISFELDIDKYEDPDECFAAFERMETAKEEYRKLTGQPLTNLDQNRGSLPARRLRPGLPGLKGKSVRYKHRPYPSIGFSNSDEALLSSQEASDPKIVSPRFADTIPETNVMKFSPQARVSDKSTMELDELLSLDCEGLDENEIQKLMQDKLNIKPIDIGKPSLPDLPDVHWPVSENSGEAVSNIKDPIYHVSGTNKVAGNISYQLMKSSAGRQGSPSLPKSPLASFSLLNRHISKLTTPLKDPFSCIDIDSSPIMLSSVEKKIIGETDQTNKSPHMHESLNIPVKENETTGGSTSPLVPAGNAGGLINGSKGEFVEVSHNDQIVMDEMSHEFQRPPAQGEESIPNSGEEIPSPLPKDVAQSSEPEELVDQISLTAQAGAKEYLFESARSPTNGELDLADPTSSHIEQEDPVVEARASAREEFSKGSGVKGSAFNRGEDGETGGPLTSQSGIESPGKQRVGPSKKKRRETMALTVPAHETTEAEIANKGRKGKAKSSAPVSKEPNNKRKVQDALPAPVNVDQKLRRLSLYGAGTKWEAGLRRSSRIRMRPLKFWRGERFLYGRVHESLVSVIGVKYVSPTKDAAEDRVKVKSFVSDKYKDLVELASLH